MAPIRKGDGTAVDPKGVSEMRKGDGSVLYSASPDSAVARYTFDDSDTESGTTLDVWNNNDGSINGATTGVSGANQTYTTNEAYSFDGTDDNVTIPASVVVTGDKSFSFWWYWDNLEGGGGDFQFLAHSDNNPLFYYNDDTEIRIINTQGGGGRISWNAPASGTWVHTTFVYNGSDWEVYIDGSSIGTISAGDVDNSNDWLIGESQYNNAAGGMDDWRFYNKALGPTEVSNLYNTGSISG